MADCSRVKISSEPKLTPLTYVNAQMQKNEPSTLGDQGKGVWKTPWLVQPDSNHDIGCHYLVKVWLALGVACIVGKRKERDT